MKLAVCIKQISHVYARTGNRPGRHFLAEKDRIYRINPYDEAAMQTAVRIKQKTEKTRIIALVLGPVIAPDELDRCLAMGADERISIETPEVPDTWQKSKILAAAVKTLGPDILLCGKESLDTRNGQIGAFMARHLNLGFVSAIRHISVEPGKTRALVRRKAGPGAMETLACELPAVFSVDMPDNVPAGPPWSARKDAGSLPAAILRIPANPTGAKVRQIQISQPRPRPRQDRILDTGLSSYDRTRQLLAPTRIQKKGSLKKGDPATLARTLVTFLTKNNSIKTP